MGVLHSKRYTYDMLFFLIFVCKNKKRRKDITRSNSVLLVKNIPFSTEEQDLSGLFSKFGSLGRVLLPPSKSMAVVEFIDSGDAKRA